MLFKNLPPYNNFIFANSTDVDGDGNYGNGGITSYRKLDGSVVYVEASDKRAANAIEIESGILVMVDDNEEILFLR